MFCILWKHPSSLGAGGVLALIVFTEAYDYKYLDAIEFVVVVGSIGLVERGIVYYTVDLKT